MGRRGLEAGQKNFRDTPPFVPTRNSPSLVAKILIPAFTNSGRHKRKSGFTEESTTRLHCDCEIMQAIATECA